MSDTSAYFIGKSYGRGLFFNQISPNKTLEGFFGSLFSCFVFVILFCFFRDFDLYFSIKLIMLSTFAIISSFGDLSVSLIKRFSDKKDTGSILPGHGGILDRVDSFYLLKFNNERKHYYLGFNRKYWVNTLNVISLNRNLFNVFALAANSSVDKLFEQCKIFKPKFAHLNEENSANKLIQLLKDAKLE